MKYVLITGVSSGIGQGMARGLIEDGCHVIGSVRSDKKGLELSRRFGERFTPLKFDINNRNEITRSAEKIAVILNNDSLAAIINNAGFAEIGPLLHVSMDDFKKQLDTLVVGQLSVIQEFHKYLIPSQKSLRPGRIINVSSVSGKYGNPFFGCYCAGKHALEGLSKTLRKELEIYGIPLVVVSPGNIATSIWDKQTLEIVEKYKDTAYYPQLLNTIKHVNTNIIKNAMTINEFFTAFLKIFKTDSPADRYTIIKSKKKWVPFGKEAVRIVIG